MNLRFHNLGTDNQKRPAIGDEIKEHGDVLGINTNLEAQVWRRKPPKREKWRIIQHVENEKKKKSKSFMSAEQVGMALLPI